MSSKVKKCLNNENYTVLAISFYNFFQAAFFYDCVNCEIYRNL